MKAFLKAMPVDLSQAIPSTAKSVMLHYKTTPRDASLLIYASPDAVPVRVSGEGQIRFPISGRTIYVQKTNDLRDSSLEIVGYDL